MTFRKGHRVAHFGVATACLVVLAINAAFVIPRQNSVANTVKVTKATPVESTGVALSPAGTGCWEVTLNRSSELTSIWVPECPATQPALLGERPMQPEVLRLPALSSGEPPMAQAQPRAVMSADLAQRGAGALVYLPASPNGAGYYVAAWAIEEPASNPELPTMVKSGLQVGIYGAPPSSVMTPAGRVYLNSELSPRGRQFSTDVVLHDADGPDDLDDPQAQVDAPDTATAAASARVSSTF